MKIMRVCGLAVLAALGCAPLRAGLPEVSHMRHLSMIDGLPSNVVYDVVQDVEGYLWFATTDGLARYDGTGFRVWHSEDGLGDNELDALCVDPDNRLWIGTENSGVVVLDAKRQQFEHIRQVGDVKLDTSPIWSLACMADGTYWIGTYSSGLYRLRADGGVDHFLPEDGNPHSLPGRMVTALNTDRSGALWAGTDNGAVRWTGKDFQRMPDSEYISGMTPDRIDGMWTQTMTYGRHYSASGQPLPLPWAAWSKAVTSSNMMLHDADGGYWVRTPDGVSRFSGGQMSAVPLFDNLMQGFVRPQFDRALVSKDGGLWLTSYDVGVWYLPWNWRMFQVLKNDAGNTTFGNKRITAAAVSASGKVWMAGMPGVLDEVDMQTGSVRHVYRSEFGHTFDSVMEAADGTIWVGHDEGLLRYDPATGKVQEWDSHSKQDATPYERAFLVAQDADGLIWFWFMTAGLQARTADGRVVQNIGLGDGRGLEQGLLVTQLRRGPDGNLWLAGTQGLLSWNRQSQRFAPVPGVTAGAVNSFAVAANGMVWMTRLGVLESYKYNAAGVLQRVQTLTEAQGLPKVIFRGIKVDRNGILWLASSRGLVQVDPARPYVRIYGVGDGLPGQEISFAPLQLKDDKHMLVGVLPTAVIFNPDDLQPPAILPGLVIDSVSIRRAAERVELATDAPFSIDYNDRDLRVTARLLSFNDANGNQYRFHLSGFDDGWVETGVNGERTFSRLFPGNYRLEIAGRTADNIWSQPRVVEFSVAPPWWLSRWALTAFAVSGLLLIWAAAVSYQLRVKRRAALQLAEHKRELAEQASQAKTRFLATLGHEVRTPMTGVLGMSELLMGTSLSDKQRSYTASIQGAGKHLLRLVNDALDLARIEAGKLQLDEQDFDLCQLISDVTGLVEPNALQRGLRFDSNIAADTPCGLRGDPHRVRQILLNLLNNAIKFTEAGKVDLKVSPREGGGVRFIISDTGPGISAEQHARLFQRFEQANGARTAARYGGSGLGLAICQELVLAMDGQIDIDSVLGSGTRFIVDLPLPQAAAMPATATVAESMAAPTTLALSILLVEDDPTVAEVMMGLLQARGHVVHHVPHGLAALAEAAAQRFDLGMLDLDLPGIDGLALAQQLRAQGFNAPLLAVTARADANAEPQARAAGFDGFLRKPVTGEMLNEAAETLVL
jgi:signal transduction histidine kinase/CheY-like chemotaxis protein/sugar lactone lactonase YvrE